MRFVTLNPRTKNVNLVKDVGLIPYYLHVNYDVDATVVTYKNDDEYPYIKNEVAGLKLEFIRKRFGRQLDGMFYVLKNAKSIDVLNVYHLNTASLLAELAYKIINKTGKIYLKLDMSQEGLRTALLKDPRGMIKRLDIRLADVVSVETKKIQEVLANNFGNKIIYVTNGCLLPKDYKDEVKDRNTENVILTVANFGTWEKASDTLLEAFKLSAGNHDYKLKIIGKVADDFKPFISKFFKENPSLTERVEFLGEIQDRDRLKNEYRKSKIFTLPSRQESFGIVLVEAAYEGCYLVTTESTTAGYDVSDNGKYGSIVKTDDVNALANAFTRICNDTDYDWNEHAEKISAYAKRIFNWDNIVEGLYSYLK